MVIIMGLPGAGKTVQSQMIQDKLGFHWLSTGQMLRESEDPDVLAVQATGALVNDELVTRIVRDRLKKEGHDREFLLDGFPRNTAQAEWLVGHAGDINKHVKLVLFMDVDEDIANKRLGGRGRKDDNQAALAKRHEEQKKLAPMLDYLKKIGTPVEVIDANRTVEEIFTSVEQAISKYVDLPVNQKS